MVSASRISPTKITSGSSRIISLRPSWKDLTSRPTSRWEIDRVLLRQDVLDRVFHRDDPAGGLLADPSDQRGNRRGLAGPGDAGQQDQPRLEIDDVLPDVIGEADVLDLRDVQSQGSDRRGEAVVVAEDVDAELQVPMR